MFVLLFASLSKEMMLLHYAHRVCFVFIYILFVYIYILLFVFFSCLLRLFMSEKKKIIFHALPYHVVDYHILHICFAMLAILLFLLYYIIMLCCCCSFLSPFHRKNIILFSYYIPFISQQIFHAFFPLYLSVYRLVMFLFS